MIGANDADVARVVAADFAAAMGALDHKRQMWLRLHSIPPRRITLSRKTDGSNAEDFWLVSDHTGSDDASFRLVYDDVAVQYGIECAILNSISLFIGFRATLVDAITDIKVVR